MLIRLPLPPTDNELHVVSRSTHRLVNSAKYRKWTQEAGKLLFELKLTRNEEPTYVAQHSYSTEIVMPNYKSDFTNYVKATKDVLQGFLYKDDQWVLLDIQMPVLVDPTLKTGYIIIDTVPVVSVR